MSVLQRFRVAVDRAVTVANLVDELLERTGDGELSIDESGRWRLSDLHADICRKDAFLRRSIRLVPGQPVAVYRTNDLECFRWFLAIVRAGGVAVPLNPQLTAAEVRRILASCGADVLVTDTAVFGRTILSRQALPIGVWVQADDARESLPGFLRVGRPEAIFAPTRIDPAATIAVFHTSGTSGFPKGAALSSTALLGARASTVLWRALLGPRDLALIALPWSHVMAVSVALYGLLAGVRGCFLERFDVEAALRLVEQHGVTAVVGVPATFVKLVNASPEAHRLRTIRVWVSASDYLPGDIRQRLRAFGALARLPGCRVPPVLLNGYGMAELGGLVMVGIELPFLKGSADFSIPVPPYRARVVDADGRSVPPGVVGECQVRRRGTRPHYWRDVDGRPDLLTPDGWLRTGDLATRHRFGFVRFVGRMKDVIKTGGYSVYARELEETLSSHPAVSRVAAFPLPHREKGEIPAAVVELREATAITEHDLLDWCRATLAPYKTPRRIWIVPAGELPLNPHGKVMRQALAERFSSAMSP